jgi:HAAS domain-containing protein
VALLDNYLDAVRKLLPRAERADIVAELRDVLLSQIEDEQRLRGRALNGAELAAVLQRYGAPETVAARYGAPRYLIGPEVYPHYVFSAKVVAGLVGAVVLALAVTSAATADEPLLSIGRTLWTGAIIVLVNLAFVTLIFIHIERMTAKAAWSGGWDPRELVKSDGERIGWWTIRPMRRTSIPRSEAVVGMCFSIFWLLWWTDVLPINRWFLWSRLPLEPAPIWHEVTPLVMTVIVGSLVTQVVAIARPRAVMMYEGASLLLDVGLLALAGRAIAAGALIVVTVANSPVAGLAGLLNVLGWVGLVLLALMSLASIAFTIFKWAVGREAVAVL